MLINYSQTLQQTRGIQPIRNNGKQLTNQPQLSVPWCLCDEPSQAITYLLTWALVLMLSLTCQSSYMSSAYHRYAKHYVVCRRVSSSTTTNHQPYRRTTILYITICLHIFYFASYILRISELIRVSLCALKNKHTLQEFGTYVAHGGRWTSRMCSGFFCHKPIFIANTDNDYDGRTRQFISGFSAWHTTAGR